MGAEFYLYHGCRPIAERFLRPNHVFAMEWKGMSENPSVWLFGRVISVRRMQYAPYSVIDASGTVVDIEPSSHQTELLFRDPRSPTNEILYYEATTIGGWPWLMHGAIGIEPEQIKMWVRQPSGGEYGGRFPKIDPISPANNDNISYMDSVRSPYNCPTDFRELVIYPKFRIGAEYYNTDDEEHINPVLNLDFALYRFEVLQPGIHADAIRDIALHPGRSAFFRAGISDFAEPMDAMVAKDWEAQLITMKEAATL